MVLSSLFIADVLSYSTVWWYDDESVLLAKSVLLIWAWGHHKFLPIDMLIWQTWSKKMRSKMASMHQIFTLSDHKSR
jgi:succinate dehydrogenase/fumarate reductase cytochrome b subunit